MAEPILSVIAELVLKNLGHLVIQETGLLSGCNQEKEKLHDTVSAIKDTLEDVENGEFIITEPVKNWLGKLKDVLYDADDVLDDFQTEALRRKLDDSITKKVRSFFSRSNLFVYNLKMGHRIKHISERLDNIKKDRDQFETRAPHNPARLVGNVHHQRDTHSGLPSSVMFGRDESKSNIVKLLMAYSCGNVDSELVSVIAIHGMGGIGKTTLAKLVYNDSEIENHFDVCIWVCVSDDFDQKKIVEKILKSLRVSRQEWEGLELQPLQILLREKLGGKMYMLVLDDVWNEDRNEWVELTTLLNCGKRGSTILVTTRSTRVVEVMGSNSSLPVSGLSDDDSWSVFKQRAFKRDQKNPTLEEIGRDIARKCRGLPLALSALGSLLYDNNNEDDWKRVRDNEMLRNLTTRKLNVLPVLQFSFDNLPSSQLKHCFAYCSLFPKDFDIPKELLIHLWMAQGFLQASDPTRQRMEDIGNHYFNILLSRSFFQDVVEDDYGNIATCKMHDLMHDLAKSVSGGECLIVDEIGTPIQACVRHMHLSCYTCQGLSARHKLRTFHIAKYKVEVSHDAWSSFRYLRVLTLSSVTQEQLCHISELKHLRCLLVSGDISIKKLPKSIIMLQNLQTLNVVDCDLKKLPKDIGKIESLRHIDISDNHKIKTLPDSICKLTNLQSLVLKNCFQLKALPEDIGNMVSLRQLELNWDDESIFIPSGVRKLTRLQTLSVFNVGNDGDRLHPNLSVLHGLNNLRGTLSIRNLENATTSEAKVAKLRDKQYLESLSLEWNMGSGDDGSDNVDFLEALEPHRNLQKLWIDGYGGASFPEEWLRGLTSLRSLSIKKCHSLISLSQGMQYLTALKELSIVDCKELNLSEEDGMHGLHNLQDLELGGLPKLVLLPKGLQHATNLQYLWFYACENLMALPEWLGNFASLKNLHIDKCPNVQSLPQGMQCLTKLEELIIIACPHLSRRCKRGVGEDWPKIAHIRSVEVFEGEGRGSKSMRQILRLTKVRRIRGFPHH